VKPRSRKGRSTVQGKPAVPAATAAHVPQPAAMDELARGALPHFSQVWATGAQQVPEAAGQAILSTTANTRPLTTVFRYRAVLSVVF